MPWCPAARCTQLHVSCEPAFRNHAECTYRYMGVLNTMRDKHTWFARKLCSLHSTLCNLNIPGAMIQHWHGWTTTVVPCSCRP